MTFRDLKDLLDSAWLVLGGAAFLLWRASRLVKRVEDSPTREEFNDQVRRIDEVRRHSGLDLPAAQVVVVTKAPARFERVLRDEDA